MKPYKENHFQGEFSKDYKQSHKFPGVGTVPYELKRTIGGTVAFSKFEDQQLPSLVACKTHEGFNFKLTDASLGAKPFDGIIFRDCPASYVGIVFHANDKAKRSFWFIEIDDVMALKTIQKSITLKNCQKLGFELKL